MKAITIIALIFLSLSSLFAQSPVLDWAVDLTKYEYNFSFTPYDDARVATTDLLGNVYTLGTFRDSMDADPDPNASVLLEAMGNQDMYLTKFSSSGDFLWVKQIGGDSTGIAPNDMKIDRHGNLYITGSAGTVDFDPGSGMSIGIGGMFVLKLDSSGNFVWVNQVARGGQFTQILSFSLALDSMNQVYTTGHFSGTKIFGSGLNADTLMTGSSGQYDLFIQKLDTFGNFVWVKQLVGTPNSPASSYYILGNEIELDQGGNIYIAGRFSPTTDFDPGPATHVIQANPNGNYDPFLLKLNHEGEFVWVQDTWSTGVSEDLHSVQTDKMGHIYILGTFGSEFDPPDTIDVDSGPGVSNINVKDGQLFVQKLDTSGNHIWVKQLGRGIYSQIDEYSGFPFGTHLKVDSIGDVYITGMTGACVELIPGLTNTIHCALDNNGAGNYFNRELFLVKLGANGNYRWLTTLEGTGRTWGRIHIDAFGNVYTAGILEDCADFDPGPDSMILCSAGIPWQNSPERRNGFLQKLVQCPDTGFSATILDITTCISYESPSGDTIWTSSGIYQDTVPTICGLEAYTINLQIELTSLTDTTIIVDACDSYTSPSGEQIWTASGTYLDTVKSDCEWDAYTIQLQIYQAWDTIMAVNSCGDYELNGQIYTQTGTYIQQISGPTGCDSTITIKLTIHQANSSTADTTSCGTFFYHGFTFISSGIYQVVLPDANVHGCDSTVLLDLTVESFDLMVSQNSYTLSATATASSSYQWLDCNNGYTPLIGETDSMLIVSANGSYAVIADNGICRDTSDCFLITTVGLDADFGSSITYYPNPSAGSLTIELGQQYQDIEIEVWNLVGQQMSTSTFQRQDQIQAILPEETGMYLIHVIADDRRAVLKVMRD